MRLLVFNCHEAWVHQLKALDCDLDIIVGLAGHHVEGWDTRMRPLPPRARTLNLAEAQAGEVAYDCIIAHNLTDLLDCKRLAAPRVLVLHSTYEGRLAAEGGEVPLEELRGTIRRYLKLMGGHAVAISKLKTGPDGFPSDIVTNGVELDDYHTHSGEIAAGLRVVNQIALKRACLQWDLHEAAFGGLPIKIVGHNPDLAGVEPARDWDHLKALLASHRFFVHTADPRYEDGYNMAVLEAMASGLPILGNRHPTSPIEHEVSGFLADEPEALRGYAQRLLEDRELAHRMGEAACQAVARLFPAEKFAHGFRRAIHKAQRKWRKVSQVSGRRREARA